MRASRDVPSRGMTCHDIESWNMIRWAIISSNIKYTGDVATVKHMSGIICNLWNKQSSVLLIPIVWKLFHREPKVASINCGYGCFENWKLVTLVNCINCQVIQGKHLNVLTWMFLGNISIAVVKRGVGVKIHKNSHFSRLRKLGN